MTWVKQGCIFRIGVNELGTLHAQVPTPFVMEDVIRIYYAGRDNEGRSFPAFFDLDRKDLKTVRRVHADPLMSLGKPGMFDADGIMPSCVIENNGELWLYYIGWSELKRTARYQNEIGLAVSRDGGETFQRMFEGPIMGRTKDEPGLCVMPFVWKGEGMFGMVYQSGTGWHSIERQYEPTYEIRIATSINGINWQRYTGRDIVPREPLEALSRPCLIDGNLWYCYRGSEDYRGGKNSYRIGRLQGRERSRVEIERSEFDSEMQCYPYVIDVDGQRLMFYNGNGFGQTGIGLAIWK